VDDLEKLLPQRDDGRIFVSCPFQKPCWKEIRRPIIKANKGLYLPYICSYQTEGDLENCGHYHNYIAKEREIAGDTSKGNSE